MNLWTRQPPGLMRRSVARRPLRVLLASPRGFCAGVVRAINAVEQALQVHGAPVYVRRPIVHNMAVVRALEAKGAIFIQELDEAPRGAVVILSAHGVAQDVYSQGTVLGVRLLDAICPLVAKVHREVRGHFAQGRHIVLIGHAGHPEIVGTLGQVPVGAASVVGAMDEVEALDLPGNLPLAYAVQTTFSVEEADMLIAALRARYRDLAAPSATDICYATTNRQRAVRTIAPQADAMIVAGDRSSSNANRLVETARAAGCPAQLAATAGDIDWDALRGVRTLGISAAASTPEPAVTGILAVLHERFSIDLVEVEAGSERIAFKPVAVY